MSKNHVRFRKRISSQNTQRLTARPCRSKGRSFLRMPPRNCLEGNLRRTRQYPVLPIAILPRPETMRSHGRFACESLPARPREEQMKLDGAQGDEGMRPKRCFLGWIRRPLPPPSPAVPTSSGYRVSVLNQGTVDCRLGRGKQDETGGKSRIRPTTDRGAKSTFSLRRRRALSSHSVHPVLQR